MGEKLRVQPSGFLSIKEFLELTHGVAERLSLSLLSGFLRSSAQVSLGFRTGPTYQNLVPKSRTLLTAGPAAGT